MFAVKISLTEIFVNTIKETFNKAAENAPSIVFLDDMDKFANGDEKHRDAEEYVTVQACIDEVKDKEVFVVATANSLYALPYSLLRAGRFDRVIEVNNPRGEEAVKIIDHYIKSKKFVGNIDVSTVARMMDGRSCAELETVINEAGLYAGFERSDEITMDHFMRAYLHTIHDVPSEVLSDNDFDTDLTNGNDQRTRVVYHEAGHATVAEALNPGSVTLISAYSRDGEYEGFTSCYYGNFLSTFEREQSHILCSLGGRAALEQKFGIIDIGASRDLRKAFRSTWELVTENCIRGFDLHGSYNDSPALQAKQEQATAIEVERLYRKAKEIIFQNRELFEAIAKELALKSMLTSSDIARIKSDCRCVTVGV